MSAADVKQAVEYARDPTAGGVVVVAFDADLLSLGHRTVHHVAIPSESGTRGREAGWRQAPTETAAPAPEAVHAGWDARSAYEAGRVLAEDGDVTAILCGNDDTAPAVRRALYDAGRDVPGEVSLVGFDDVPGSAYFRTAAASVRARRQRGRDDRRLPLLRPVLATATILVCLYLGNHQRRGEVGRDTAQGPHLPTGTP
ncbi:substrate-binding domain-containing protein [Spirillospora sp. CA-142024]|uniref:substrate-binding domain-containing protein n=1 Tax=Spirillospora sp. CA-142024 TaxID=3240036 RepID=UPI003D8F418C